jgi:hypothetical protein
MRRRGHLGTRPASANALPQPFIAFKQSIMQPFCSLGIDPRHGATGQLMV